VTAPVRKDEQSITEVLADLKELTVSYAKQETVDPLRNAGRYLGFGIPGAFCMSLGVLLLGIAGLRALQSQTDTTFTGNWSWAPYLIVSVVLLVLAGLFGWLIFKDAREHKREEDRP
jgi:hypothetical protein